MSNILYVDDSDSFLKPVPLTFTALISIVIPTIRVSHGQHWWWWWWGGGSGGGGGRGQSPEINQWDAWKIKNLRAKFQFGLKVFKRANSNITVAISFLFGKKKNSNWNKLHNINRKWSEPVMMSHNPHYKTMRYQKNWQVKFAVIIPDWQVYAVVMCFMTCLVLQYSLSTTLL